MAFSSIPSAGNGRFPSARGSQMVLMQSIHGGALNNPTLNGIDALRIIGYWWRTRGRFGKEWVRCLKKLKASGLAPTTASAFKVFTEAQSKIVWDCAAEAVAGMRKSKLGRNLPPLVFSDRQSLADAKAVAKRFLSGNFTGRIPPALALPPLPRKKKPPASSTAPARPPTSTARPPDAARPGKQGLVPPPPKIPDDLFDRVPRVKRPRLNVGKLGWIILAVIVADEMRKSRRD